MAYKLSSMIDSVAFPKYAREALKIITMEGTLVNLNLNQPQQLVHSILQKQHAANLPMRAIVLKARREGVSTYVSARYFREINRLPMRYACTCSADAGATDKVFKMVRLFQDSIPDDLRRETDYSSRKEIAYSAPHRSQFLCQTAGTDVLGRGGLTHYLHATEFAFWKNAKEQFGGAAQEVPADPETMIVIESTANGMGGAFYDMFLAAVERYKKTKSLDGFMPIFLPWHIFERYRRTPPRGWEPSHEEKEIQREFKLDIEQIYWRNWAIENQCQGDIELFRQEYPATWKEAFRTSGAPVFNAKTIDWQAKQVRSDIRYGLFDPYAGTFQENRDGSHYGWQVLDEPRGEEHVIGVDTREHRLSDDQDPKSDRDYDGVVVMSRNPSLRRVKAIFHGRMAQKDLGLQVLGAAKHFGNAWVVPEVPQGMMVLQVLRDAGYEYIFNRRGGDETYDPEDTDNLGFRTTVATRHVLVNETIPFLRSQSIMMQFESLVDEMRTFIYDKMGKPIHMPGEHDDLLFGLFLAMTGDIYCPHTATPAILPATTGNTGAASYLDRYRDPDHDLCYSGAIDDWDPDDYYDEETTTV